MIDLIVDATTNAEECRLTPKELRALRDKTKAAIERDGIGAVAAKVQVGPPTLWRFVSGVGRTHKGTVKLIEEALK